MADKKKFVHLHVHSEYSLLNSTIRIKDLLMRIREYDMSAVAITDCGNMSAAMEFYTIAESFNIKPIIGCEVYVTNNFSHNYKSLADGQINKAPFHLVLLAENNEGYSNLCKIVSYGHLEGSFDRPYVNKEILRQYSKGLIALSAGMGGEIPQLLLNKQIEAAKACVEEHLEIFGKSNYFLEIQNNNLKNQKRINGQVIKLAQELDVPLVATNDCHYLNKNDAQVYDVLLCIKNNKTVDDKERLRVNTRDNLYLRLPDEMWAAFSAYPEALENTLKIAERCNIDFNTNYHLPGFPTPNGQSVKGYFDEIVENGFKLIWEKIVRKNPTANADEYRTRLNHEARIIKNKGFASYFLILADIVNYAKHNGVIVGPGRGSSAGSLVSYSMGITNLDPIEYGFLFERFLCDESDTMPDIDVDLCCDDIQKVYDYVTDKYGGQDYVSRIISFSTARADLTIRKVGRALNMPNPEVNAIAKLALPNVLYVKLKEAIPREPRLQKAVHSNSKVARLLEISQLLEGTFCGVSTHATGVVISDKPLVEYLPVYKDKKGGIVTQFDAITLEKLGLIKFDFLGLYSLTVIRYTLNLIQEQGFRLPDMDNLPMDDKKTFQLLQTADTTGVFQLESSGMKDILVRLKPESFDDITALVALYRPGPMDSGMLDSYVNRKHGREVVDYLLPMLEPVLKETYGVILYQEQVMQMSSVLSGYTPSQADNLRKAMAKKIAKVMQAHRYTFVKGAVKNGVDKNTASHIFDLIEKFGGYSFNKSHSTAYALIAYQTAYLKAHYPVEFMAAWLNSETNNNIVK